MLGVFPKLSESFILNEIAAVVDKGCDVTIFSIAKSKEMVLHPEIKEYELLSKTHYFLGDNSIENLRRILGSTSLQNMKGKMENIKTRISVPASVYFSRIGKSFGLDVLHAHFNGIASHTAMLMSKRLNIPFTFTTHAVDIFQNVNVSALRNRMEKAKSTITISYYNREYLHNLTGIEREKIAVVRACPRLDRLPDRETNREEISVLSIGRLVEKKGLKYAILAIKDVIKKNPKVKYKIIGSGPLENPLRKLVASLDLENNVIFFGTRDDYFLTDELRKASVFVLPCIRAQNGDMDGIPVSLMEAMCLGTPVVSTRISGIPELVGDGREGILVEPEDSKSLSDALKTLLASRILRLKMGEAGRKKIEEKFNPHHEAAKLVDIWMNS